MLLISFLAFSKVSGILAGGTGHDWDYEQSEGRLDPTNWHHHYPACGGERQSPIDLVDEAIEVDDSLKGIKFINYDKPLKNLVMINNGHTIQVTLPKTSDLRISTPSLPAPYRLLQFHFHWPSEHKINGYRFPLELHLVHGNTQLPDDQATNNTAGLVVVAVMFDYRQGNAIGNTLKNLISHMIETVSEGRNATLSNSLTLNDLLPSGTRSYVRYSGSLTTPPCAEVVEFHILTNTMPITETEVYRFTSIRHELHTEKGEVETNIDHNDRPTQNLNGRTLRLFGDMGDLPTEIITA